MPLALDKVHEHQRIPGTQEVRLVRVQPYVRLTREGDPPIFIQGGQLYHQGGSPVTERPAWVDQEIARLSDTIRAEVGLTIKDDGGQPQPRPKPKPPKAEDEPWTCPQCGKAMGKRGKSFHELHHKKQAERQSREGA